MKMTVYPFSVIFGPWRSSSRYPSGINWKCSLFGFALWLNRLFCGHSTLKMFFLRYQR